MHVTNGFEFLGYKIGKGKGLRLPAHKRTARTNPLGLYAIPRQKSVDRFKDQIRNLTRRKAPVRLREVIEAINPVIRTYADCSIEWMAGLNAGYVRLSPRNGETRRGDDIRFHGWYRSLVSCG